MSDGREQTTAPFPNATDAWMWTMRALMARQTGAPQSSGPCSVEDVVACLDRLYRQHRIEMAHVRVLRIWGERGAAPDLSVPAERAEARLWQHAIKVLDWPLRTKGIVA